MTNNITETKTVDAENFEFLLAQSDYKLNSVFRSKNPQIDIYPNTPMVTNPTQPTSASWKNWEPADTTQSGTFSFDINHTTNALIDLKDFYFDINAFVGDVAKMDDVDSATKGLPLSYGDLRFATQPLLSLFDHYDLYIDDVLIERSNYGSLSANARYALEYPHSNKAEEGFQVNGWCKSNVVSVIGSAKEITDDNTVNNALKSEPEFNNTISYWVKGDVVIDTDHYKQIYGNICQKLKLSDLFSCINTLPPIFNHSVRVLLVRANTSYVGCDTRSAALKLKLAGFQTFKLSGASYIITDQLKNACEKYYSKPIETLYTSRTEIINTIPSNPTASAEISFVINTNLAYKNKCLVLCIPRTSNPAGLVQPFSYTYYVGDNSTMTTANHNQIQYSEMFKCYNDYTTGGLAQIDITTANGLRLAHYHMDRDGEVNGMTVQSINPLAGFDVRFNNSRVHTYNYLEPYEQYKKCREHFNQLPEEGIDYISFLKTYCIYCVDLSPFDITANEQIRITLKTGSWENGYNPFCLYNQSGTIAAGTGAQDAGSTNSELKYRAIPSNQASTCILVNLYSDQILRLLPGGKCEVVQLFSQVADNVNETQ